MLKNFIKKLDDMIPEERELLTSITYEELEEALDEIGRDIVYNYLIFEKEVSFEVFLSNLKIYLSIIKNRL
ncbi:hypothetical protein [Proteiniborus sp. MB09-C3]|uniref:hypothetical protein n=1 Tax=Proteiniborus sp. MB09-C3 TaxID=3050072 RepID=UPI00255635AE|nr:hypothetical protein [Proteiniborus sp. MB09-C3]WIV13338.1 hypothetical protein QO263_06395 [Proteiniborus sp. MB09-C3]